MTFKKKYSIFQEVLTIAVKLEGEITRPPQKELFHFGSDCYIYLSYMISYGNGL